MAISTENQRVDRKKYSDGYELAFRKKKLKSDVDADQLRLSLIFRIMGYWGSRRK